MKRKSMHKSNKNEQHGEKEAFKEGDYVQKGAGMKRQEAFIRGICMQKKVRRMRNIRKEGFRKRIDMQREPQ